jgi:hypothetical protein
MASMGMEEMLADFQKILLAADLFNVRASSQTNKTLYDVDANGNRIKPVAIGQLQTKLEAAGKIRVFAMVDVWTQSVLKPLHDFLFSVLKKLPNDATFDQNAAVERCFAKASKAKVSFGYDLSAATDRLPVSLQVSILSVFIGRKSADL